MAVVVRIQNERGDLVHRVGVVTALDRQWTEEEEAKYPWLTTIDPYGDTTFNYRQLKHLRHELIDLRSNLAKPEDRQQLDLLIQAIEEFPDRHLYLKLIGE